MAISGSPSRIQPSDCACRRGWPVNGSLHQWPWVGSEIARLVLRVFVPIGSRQRVADDSQARPEAGGALIPRAVGHGFGAHSNAIMTS